MVSSQGCWIGGGRGGVQRNVNLREVDVLTEMTSYQTGFVSSFHIKAFFPVLKYREQVPISFSNLLVGQAELSDI